jgi:transcription antitermination factor NusG
MFSSSIPPQASDVTFFWHALYTRHQHEKTVARLLAGKGFETFLPLYSALHRWKNGVKQLSVPLFPGYVFLRGPLERWLPVLTTPGIHTVVGFGGKPAMIPRSEIEAIRRVVESSVRAEPHPFIRCGDRVRIKSGPLQGLEGVLLRKKGQWKLLLSVEMLERSVAVEVDVTAVESVTRRDTAHSQVQRLMMGPNNGHDVRALPG